MAIGDAAQAAQYLVVPEDGPDGRVRWGAREINRTRDYVAEVKSIVPVGRQAYRTAAGIFYGTNGPPVATTPGQYLDGDVYLHIVNTTLSIPVTEEGTP
jgi:hypothetical protein